VTKTMLNQIFVFSRFTL